MMRRGSGNREKLAEPLLFSPERETINGIRVIRMCHELLQTIAVYLHGRESYMILSQGEREKCQSRRR